MITRILPYNITAFKGQVKIDKAKTDEVIAAYNHLPEQREALKLNVDNFVKTVERETPDSQAFDFKLAKCGTDSNIYALVTQQEEGEEPVYIDRQIKMFDGGRYTSGEYIYKAGFRPLIYSATHNGEPKVKIKQSPNQKIMFPSIESKKILKKLVNSIEPEIPDDLKIEIETEETNGSSINPDRTRLVLDVTAVSGNERKHIGTYAFVLCERLYHIETELAMLPNIGWVRTQVPKVHYNETSPEETEKFIDDVTSSVLKELGIDASKIKTSDSNQAGLVSYYNDQSLKQAQTDGKISFSENNESVIERWDHSPDRYKALKGNVQSLARKLNDETPPYKRYKISLLNLKDELKNIDYVSVAVQNLNDGSVIEQRIPFRHPVKYSWEKEHITGQEIWEKGFKPLCEKLGLSC